MDIGVRVKVRVLKYNIYCNEIYIKSKDFVI